MCFSAEADLVAGAAVAAVGVDALRHVRRPREVALASLPLLLASHQLTEAFVWSDLEQRTPPVGTGATISFYALVAFVVLPALVPFAVLAVEPTGHRRRLMAPFAVLGVLVAVAYGGAIAQSARSRATTSLRHGLEPGGAMAALYVAAVCVPLFASSYERVVVFGVCNAVAVGVLLLLSQEELTSLWCAWAAVTSTFIAVHLRIVNPTESKVSVRPGGGAGLGRVPFIGRGACT